MAKTGYKVSRIKLEKLLRERDVKPRELDIKAGLAHGNTGEALRGQRKEMRSVICMAQALNVEPSEILEQGYISAFNADLKRKKKNGQTQLTIMQESVKDSETEQGDTQQEMAKDCETTLGDAPDNSVSVEEERRLAASIGAQLSAVSDLISKTLDFASSKKYAAAEHQARLAIEHNRRAIELLICVRRRKKQ